jgi:hypothetical protein
MSAFVPVWILGAPIVGMLILSFSFKGPSAMGGELPRTSRDYRASGDMTSPVANPMYPDAPRRSI